MRSAGNLVLAAALFLVSGALGLGYQLVWIRKAALLVGSSQIALATVLASFFLGIALGSLFVGRRFRSPRLSPLLVYGLFELAIGAFALCFPWVFGAAGAVYAALYDAFAGSAAALLALRFALGFALFLLPTFFMGGTLPLLLDGLVARDRAVGALTSLLYGLNILGAVGGVLFAGYVAIPRLGLDGTTAACGFGNLAIAAVALLAFRATPPLRTPGRAAAPERFFALLAFGSGFAALGYQVAWARYFGLFTPFTVHLNAVLLAVYLSALALGSLALAPALRRGTDPLRLLALLQPLVPLWVLYGLPWWTAAAYGFSADGPAGSGEVAASWALLSETLDATLLAPVLRVALVLFVPVALLGTGLPAIIAAATRTSGALRSSAGDLVFWNTVGASAGSFAAGYALIPGLGLGGALLALAGVSIALGAAAWLRGWRVDGRRAGPELALFAVSLAVCLLFAGRDLTRETLRHTVLLGPDAELVDVIEGPLVTAHVATNANGLMVATGPVMLALALHDEPSGQAIQGHTPVLLYPGEGVPRDCLGIALGSGQAFGALLAYPIERLDVVDLSSEVIALSLEHFAAYQHGLGDDSRVRFHLDDGRHFVERAPDASYDLVELEPPPPTAEGVHTLYSLEFYESVDRVLRDGGVFMQWLPLYLLTPQDTRGLVATQLAVFPHTFVVKTADADMMLLSFKGEAPPRLSAARIRERLPVFAAERRVAGYRWNAASQHDLASLEGVLATIVSGPEDLAALAAPAPFRDDDLRLSYGAGDRELLRRYEALDDRSVLSIAHLSFAALPRTPFAQLARYFDGAIPAAALDEERARSLGRFRVPWPSRLAAAGERWASAQTPRRRARAALELAALHDAALDKRAALAWVARAIEARAHDAASLDAIRRVARNHIAVYADVVRAWHAGLAPELRARPGARAVAEELADFERREAARRRRYLLGSPDQSSTGSGRLGKTRLNTR